MRQLSAQELANELKIVAQISAKLLTHPVTDLKDEISRLGAFLQACETRLIKLMNNEHPSETEPGVTQYGLALYVLDTTHPVLRRLLGFPKSQITPALLKQWEAQIGSGGVDDYEGSLIAIGKYEQLDAGWVTALIYYLALKLGVREVSSWATFGTSPATIRAQGDIVKIAIVGDWGTGPWDDGAIEYPALQVIDQVKQLAPDYTIHLGDVYYAVLTHHNPTNIEGTGTGTGTGQLRLWNDVTSALGKAPDFWYWGHIHNGIVYSDQSFPAQNGTKARCAGHGAIPFGVGYGLQNPDGTNKPSIAYFAHELLSSVYENTDAQQANRVLNGFAMLTLKPDSISEEFIDQTGAVRWSQTTTINDQSTAFTGLSGGIQGDSQT